MNQHAEGGVDLRLCRPALFGAQSRVELLKPLVPVHQNWKVRRRLVGLDRMEVLNIRFVRLRWDRVVERVGEQLVGRPLSGRARRVKVLW